MRQAPQALGVAQHEVPARPEGAHERAHGLAEGVVGEIDGDVAAHDEVGLADGRRLPNEVVLCETDHAPEIGSHLHLIAVLEEETVAVEAGNTLDGRRRVHAFLSERQHTGGDVGGHDLDVGRAGGQGHHGQGVGLLAGGAARRPDAERPSTATGVVRQPGHDALVQRIEELAVAEELGLVDGDGVDDAAQLARPLRAFEKQRVVVPADHAASLGPVAQVEAQDVAPPLGELEAEARFEEVADALVGSALERPQPVGVFRPLVLESGSVGQVRRPWPGRRDGRCRPRRRRPTR